MTHGKAVELFLTDGTPEGIVTAELLGWNGKAVKIPRTEVTTCGRAELSNVGVYFLICTDDEGENSVYIGEAGNILNRLKQHLTDYSKGTEKYYWSTAIVFVGDDLNKALIRYLENRLVELAKASGNYKILTKATYQDNGLKEAQIAAMEDFIDNIKILLGAMSYRILAPAPQAKTTTEYLFCKSCGALAKGFISSGGFTVLKDSTISECVAPSFSVWDKNYFKLRNKLIEEGVIINGVFNIDYEFTSPSAASAVIKGCASNGNIDWKTANGKKLKEIKI